MLVCKNPEGSSFLSVVCCVSNQRFSFLMKKISVQNSAG